MSPESSISNMKKTYNWKRFWCPREGKINLSDDGYLFNPDSDRGKTFNPDLVSSGQLASIPCLVFLGEPGIGKSFTIKNEVENIRTLIKSGRDKVLYIDLRAYGSEDRLIENVFRCPTFLEWLDEEYRLYIYLDSLDECLLRIDNLCALLLDEFKKYSIERISLRIASRTAEWPISFENGLEQLWGKHNIKVYELVPLRKIDVVEAAKSNNLDSEQFLTEIERKEIVPLVIKPVTLNFLLNIYAKNMKFPDTKKDLYLEGCRLLCEEIEETRPTGTLSSKQRMLVAARIAAVTTFGNKYAIWKGKDYGEVPEEDIIASRLCGDTESIDGIQFQINEDAIMETLATGLFSSRGPNRMGWSHQTLAEFLGSWYLVQKNIDLVQILSLISHPEDPEKKVPPQLHESVGWLATIMPTIFQYMIEREPEVLLRSDVAIFELNNREKLLNVILKLVEENKFLRFGWDMHKWYRKLNNPNLSEQLKPYICNKAKSEDVRNVAIDIAEACELRVLQIEIATVALDQSEPIYLRGNAANAIEKIGDSETKKLLKPLALGEGGNDPYDQLKGYGLRATWPEHLSNEELFSILTPPKRHNFVGSYEMFLEHDLKESIKSVNLVEALKWGIKQEEQRRMPHPFKELLDIFIYEAWENFDLPGILENLAELILLRLKHHDMIIESNKIHSFNDLLKKDTNKRRRLIETIVPLLKDPDKDSIYLMWTLNPIVLDNDIVWIREQLKKEQPEAQRSAWEHLIIRMLNWKNRKQLISILKIRKYSPLLKKSFSIFWLLSALYAAPLFRIYLEYKQRRNYPDVLSKRLRKVRINPQARINKLLKQCEVVNSNAWWRLNMEMTLEQGSSHYGNELESSLKNLPGWKKADSQVRLRIIKSAKRYILDSKPDTHKWLGRNIIYRAAFSGYRALKLLLEEEKDFIANLPKHIWKKWVPIIVAYPLSSGTNEGDIDQILIEIGYRQAPDEFIRTLLILINKENKEQDHVFIVQKIENCLDDRLADVLLNSIKHKKFKPTCMGDILEVLLKNKYKEAKTYAESLLQFPLPTQVEERTKVVIATRMLINNTDDAGWVSVWPLFQHDTAFGKEVVLQVAHGAEQHSASIGRKLAEDQLADLYIWIMKIYPYEEDPKFEGAHFVGPRESVAHWRDNILNHLKNRGTYHSCNAIEKIIQAFPKLKEWLNILLLEARIIARQHTWTPFEPEDILKVARDQQLRLVQNGEQLLSVLIESLKRLEIKLHGETPAVIDLWNEVNEGIFEPKEENNLTDYIKRHIEEDLLQRGIIVNREVQIRRGTGGAPGEVTDIHVDAIKYTSDGKEFDKVSAIIEVKGCWHRELDSAMKTQLVERYLKDNRCKYGLYLVGWFFCSQWNPNDPRKKQVRLASKDEAEEKFNLQATELSLNDTLIRALVINTALR